MKTISCYDPNCAALCTLTQKQYDHAKDTGAGFYCSNGHSNVFRPSRITKLKEKIDKLERSLTYANKDTAYWQRRYDERWRCPFARCGHQCDSQGSMVRHIKGHHLSAIEPKRLAANAGPDALNSTVH